jgi:hypothetical protein
MAILSAVSYLSHDCDYERVWSGVSMSSILHYTQGIIREATVALLEDMIGHWIRGLPG